MKKITILLPFFVLLTAFTCENEPLEGEFTENLSCPEAAQNTIDATTNFANTTQNDANYNEVCIAYRDALQDQITACGDTDGTIQLIIDTLDCNVVTPPDDCVSATQAVIEAQANFDSAQDFNYTSRCNALKAALETKIEFCQDTDGSIQAEIDALGDCSNNVGSVPDHHAFMTANLNGEQFDNLKPNGYNLLNTAIGVVSGFNGNDETYIRIQGNSTYTNVNPTNNTKEITLFIPESNWEVGTHDLVLDSYSVSNGETPAPHYWFFYRNNDDYTFAIKEVGTISITEFSLTDRVIKGTFEFTFYRENDNFEQIGPFDCLNGTFDYSLDNEYFD